MDCHAGVLSAFIRVICVICDSEGPSESRITRISRRNADKIPASTPFDQDELVRSNPPSARALIRVYLRHLRFSGTFRIADYTDDADERG